MTRRELVAALLVAVACRGTSARAPSEAGEVDRAEASESDEPPAVEASETPERSTMPEADDLARAEGHGEIEAKRRLVESAASSVKPEPPEPQTMVPVPPPFPARLGVLEPPDDWSPVVLFADETVAVRRRVAEQLERRGRRLVPFEELERIEAAAAEGRLVLEDDRRCRVPLTHRDLRARYFPTNPRVLPSIFCLEDCRMYVSASRGEGEQWEHLYEYSSGVVRDPHEPSSWSKVRLRKTGGVVGGVVGGMMGGALPVMRFDVPESIGPWRDPPGPLHGEQTRAARCVHPDPRLEIVWQLRLAVEADGSIGRCEATSGHPEALSASAGCLCDVLEEVRYPKGKPGRRLRLVATDDGHQGFSGYVLDEIQAGTDAWIERVRQAAVLERCIEMAPPPRDFEATLVLGVRPDGEVHDVRVFGEIDTPLEIDFARCMVGELPTVSLPCAPPGIDELQIRLGPVPPP